MIPNLGPPSQRDYEFVWRAIQEHPREGARTYRDFDGITPAAVHSFYAATACSLESELPDDLRHFGATVLLYHDCQEDSTLPLPEWLHPAVKEYIGYMTFPGGSAQERDDLWDRPPLTSLLKLFDKQSNLRDGLGRHGWMRRRETKKPGYVETYLGFALDLCGRVKFEVLPELAPGSKLFVIPEICALARSYLGEMPNAELSDRVSTLIGDRT